MKLKKLLALACSLVMATSLFASTAMVADAAVEGATATLEFAGYEVKGTTTFAKINVKATIPDTLVPYELVAADWETTFEDTYKGCMVQTVGFVIPNVSGLTYVASLSSAAEYVQIQDDKANGAIKIYAANTGAYETYYAGTVDTLATLYYRITGDVTAAYDFTLQDAVIGLVDVAVDGTVTPREYTKDDFAITNATVKPEVEEPEEPEEPEVPAAPVVSKLIDGNDMYGMKTKLADVTIPENVEVTKAIVTLDGTSKEYDLPSGVKGAVAGFIAIIRYDAELVNPAFTLTVE